MPAENSSCPESEKRVAFDRVVDRTAQMRKAAFVFLTLLPAVFSHCVTQQYVTPGTPFALGKGGADCTVVASDRRYFALFGAIPLSNGGLPAFTPEPGKSYRITDRATGWDIALTALGGWALTLTRRTIEVESCTDDIILTSRGEVEKEKVRIEKENEVEIEKAVARMTKDSGRKTIVLLHSGGSIVGDILEFDSESLVIEAEKEVEDKDAKIDRVHMRNGKVLEGTLVNQNPKSITLRMGDATRVINKADILRTEIAVKKTKELERRTVPKKDIRKVVVSEKAGK